MITVFNPSLAGTIVVQFQFLLGWCTWTELGKGWTSALKPEDLFGERPNEGGQLLEERGVGGALDDEADLPFRTSALSHSDCTEIQRFAGSGVFKASKIKTFI